MNYIERYLFALGTYLPKDSKEDILKEVDSTIHDMVEGDYSDDNVISVLKKLGNPRSFSLEYQTKKKYLIGPEFYDSFLKTLLYVTVLVGSIFFILSVFGVVTSGIGDKSILEYILSIFIKGLASFIDGAFTAALFVTIIFFAIEHSDYTFDNKFNVVKKSEWEPSMLREVPKTKPKQFKRTGLLIDIFVNVILTICFISLAKYIGVYQDGQLVTKVFNMSQFYYYGIAFIVMVIYLVVINLAMIYYKYPNYKIAFMKTIYNLLNLIIFIVFINDKKLFNPGFKEKMLEISTMSTEQFNSIWSILTIILIVLVTIGYIADTGSIFYKSYQNEQS